MSKEHVFMFWQEVEKSSELQDRLRALSGGSQSEVARAFVQLANERGFAVTSEDAAQVLETGRAELTDEQLEGISGGISITYSSRIRLAASALLKPPDQGGF